MQTVESLESRRLLSAPSVTVTSKGTLIVAGTTAAEQVTITRTNNDDPKQRAGDPGHQRRSKTALHVRGEGGAFRRISIDLVAGDSVTFDIPGKLKQPATILGGAGDDTLEAVLPGRATISGGDGNDALFSQTTTINATAERDRDVVVQTLDAKDKTGPATLLGNAGDDTLFGDSNDFVDGGPGNDVAATQVTNVTTANQARANALATVFYGRLVQPTSKPSRARSPERIIMPMAIFPRRRATRDSCAGFAGAKQSSVGAESDPAVLTDRLPTEFAGWGLDWGDWVKAGCAGG